MTLDIERLKAAALAATPGPWREVPFPYDDGLVMISIRLHPSLISDYKLIAADKKMGYQKLMREALDHMAKVEFKRIATEAIEDKQRRTLKAEKRKSTPPEPGTEGNENV